MRTGVSLAYHPSAATSAPVTFHLLPNLDALHPTRLLSAEGQVEFLVTPAGTVDYATAADLVLGGRGSATLQVQGAAITIDATALGVVSFSIGGVGAFSTGSAQIIRFLPGMHPFGSTTLSFPFTVNPNVTVDYDPTLDARVSGRGTSTLTVR